FRQWIKMEGQWLERGVGLVDGELTFVARPNALAPSDEPQGKHEDGMIIETAPAREALVETLAVHLRTNTGAALFIDYGHLKSAKGETFQAVRDHTYADPLRDPGRCDLTSHIDFEPLLGAAHSAGCAVPRPTTQSAFLLELGLLERAGALGMGKNDHVQDQLRGAVERLAGPDAMGNLFKVIAFGAPASLGNRWPGFRSADDTEALSPDDAAS
ncbi:MAG: SAM-dependent methyltransferase, partial [Pseudomonadota bacterium]